MKNLAFLIRFFRVVPPVSPPIMASFVAAAVLGGFAVAARVADPYGVLGPIFLLQTFAASSGFAVPARRGHYDLLLTSGVTRFCIGLGHLVASTVPGAICWLGIVAVEWAAGRAGPLVSASSGTIVAFFVVSALSWAITVPCPRLTGAIVWLLVLVTPVSQHAIPSALRGLVRPWTLVGVDVVAVGLLPPAAASGVALLALVAALTWICRTDVSLQVAR